MVLKVQDLSLLSWHDIADKFWLGNAGITVRVELSNYVISFLQGNASLAVGGSDHLEKLRCCERLVVVCVQTVKQFLNI